jgi:serine/threonine protein kinase
VRNHFLLTCIVLFSRKDNCWKLADFGTASHATSKRLNTTRASRGTAGYRAPETLDSENAKFNQKSDIFAFGCIIYEIVTGKRLFSDDWASLRYANTGLLPTTVWWPEYSLSDLKATALEYLVASMSEASPSKRPSSKVVQEALRLIRVGDLQIQPPGELGIVPIQVYLRSFYK